MFKSLIRIVVNTILYGHKLEQIQTLFGHLQRWAGAPFDCGSVLLEMFKAWLLLLGPQLTPSTFTFALLFSLLYRYPTDLQKRAKIDSVLDWHHLNLRHGALRLVQAVALAPKLGRQPNPQVAIEAEKLLSESLEKIETFWLHGSGPFLLGNSEPSIADLSLVCEIMQLEVLDEKDIDQILGPHKKVQQWMEDTETATKPHFEEIHVVLFETKAELQKQRLLGANNA